MTEFAPPDYDRQCGPFYPYQIHHEATCYRVYRHDQDAYDGASWNPSRPDPDDSGAGRFDPLPGDEYDYMYGATAVEAALVESLRDDISWDPMGNCFLIHVASLEGKSLVRFRTTRSLTVAEIYSNQGLAAFGAPSEVCSARDRKITRQYAAFFRQKAPLAAGLAYKTSVASAATTGACFILWSDRCHSTRFLASHGEIRLTDRVGLALTTNKLRKLGVLVIAD